MSFRSGDRFTLLTVCTGNICRSPAAERLFAAAFTMEQITVASAGTHAMVGSPISPPMAALLDDVGAPTGGFSARLLTEDQIDGADVVLAMTREHRSFVVGMVPAAVKRTFTLREFARLTTRVSSAELDEAAGPDAGAARRLGALVPRAARHRAPVQPELDDVVDPYQRAEQVYEKSFGQILPAVRTIARAALRM
ncbi:low molecular weight phosphatase family protein [Bogoriella caseilytica]|uniref:Protein-tyrosine phosphatase n=1 Tax=Bogoriella caseilytica TaxID=56055 RepID=A0A3N2BDM4_9MICO|nr:low molecular weight phosphatase family protein [Bogoriella caseilytica]ROR73335.1 protein-tyrosine phosphatase [Bogoriella caseilytica]